MSVSNQAQVVADTGNGVWLTDIAGRKYLDCVQSIAMIALGHARPKLISAVYRQPQKIWHVANIFRISGQEELAKRLTNACFADVVFFANTVTEAVEAALKTARRYHVVGGQPGRADVIGFLGAFHGRTYAAMNASGSPSYLDGFGPRLPGYVQLSLDDEAGLIAATQSPTTAAVIAAPVQGEGGARALSGGGSFGFGN